MSGDGIGTIDVLTVWLALACSFLSASYLLNSAIAGCWLRTSAYRIALMASYTFLVGIIFEQLVNTVYELVAGQKLWKYKIWPVHDGNVSGLAFLVWPAYGAHIVLWHTALEQRFRSAARSDLAKAGILAVDAPLTEIVCNTFFLALLEVFYFYYLPSDLYHLTSMQVVPLYFMAAWIGLKLFGHLEARATGWRWPVVLYLAAVLLLQTDHDV